MPIYCYECCGQKWESYHKVDDRKNEFCSECDELAEQVMAPTQRPIINEYYSENLGAQVTGPKQRERLMKAKGLEAVG